MEDSSHKATNQNKLTVDMAEFECQYCVETRTKRLSYEDGEWVHYTCGMAVSEEVAERADYRLGKGEGEHKYPQAEAEAIVDALGDTLEGIHNAE